MASTASVHPLDCVVWSALTGPQSHLAVVQGEARRYGPDFGPFAALGGVTAAAVTDLGALVAAHGDVACCSLTPRQLRRVCRWRLRRKACRWWLTSSPTGHDPRSR